MCFFVSVSVFASANEKENSDATFITYEYNAKGWLTAIKDGGTNTIVSYEYDAAGRRTRRELENNTFTTYEYDDANQLLADVHGRAGSPSQPLASYEYRYDAAGNRTNMIRSGMGFQPVHSESYSYDAADQLTGVTYATGSTTDRIVSYLYDAAGNRTNMLEILGTATNERGQLSTVDKNGPLMTKERR
jgi:YD repeat-containing protein